MFDPHAPWPFGLTAQNWRKYAFWSVVALYFLAFFDGAVTHWVLGLPGWVRGPFYIITRAGKSDWILVPSLLMALGAWAAARLVFDSALGARLREAAGIGAFIFVGVGGPGLVATTIKRIVGRARPVHLDQFGVRHFEPNLTQHSFQSFPSGDTTTIFAFAMVIAFLSPRLRPAMLVFAALVGLSRIMVIMHFPTDVLGGIAVGTIGAYAVRNWFAAEGWLFTRRANGTYVRKRAE